MQRLKELILQYFDKIALGVAIMLLSYAIFSFYANYIEDESVKKINEYSPIIERYFKQSKPPDGLELNYIGRMEKAFETLPTPLPLKIIHPYKPTEAEEFLSETDIKARFHTTGVGPKSEAQREFIPGDTEIVYKGGTPYKALIVIRKGGQENVIEQGFITAPGEIIGANDPINGKRVIDFKTGCTLMEIIPNAKKKLFTNKRLVKLDEKGEFIGALIEQEPYYISTMKIVYENKRTGSTDELWLGSTINIGTITPLLKTEQVFEEEEGGQQILESIKKSIKKLIE